MPARRVVRPIAALCAGLLAVGSYLGISPGGAPAPTLAIAHAIPCPDIQVVFARGRQDAPGLGVVGNAFFNAFRPLVGEQTVNAYAVDYPANGVGDYGAGANDMSRALQQQVAACPNSKLVVGGYSLGAAAADLVLGVNIPAFGFNNPLPPEVGNKITAIVLLGNGSQRLLGPFATLAPQYASRAIELCNEGDPVCSTGPTDRANHSDYEATSLPAQAAAFAASLV